MPHHSSIAARSGAFRPLALVGIFDLTDEVALFGRVAAAEEERAFALQAVATGAAGLLIVAFNVLGHVVVDHVADVGLIDAHAEGDRRADHANLIANEQLLIADPFARGKSGVIRKRRNSRGGKAGGQILGGLAARDVHDAAFGSALRAPGQELLRSVVFFEDAVAKIGPVESGDEALGLAQPQISLDIFARSPVAVAGHRHEWNQPDAARAARRDAAIFRGRKVRGPIQLTQCASSTSDPPRASSRSSEARKLRNDDTLGRDVQPSLYSPRSKRVDALRRRV